MKLSLPATLLFAIAGYLAAGTGLFLLERKFLPFLPWQSRNGSEAIQKAPAPIYKARDNREPLASGPGLVVFDPRSEKAQSDETADFLRAVGAYLNFYAAGQPEFGKSPMIQSRTIPVSSRFSKDLALDEKMAPAATAMMGVTHVAIGKFEGDSNRGTLTYTLLAEPSGSRVGEAITLSGTLDEIAKALPRAARDLAVRLGTREPATPPSLALTAHELALLGHTYDYSLASKLEPLLEREPLAILRAEELNLIRTETQQRTLMSQVLDKCEGNPLAWSLIAQTDPSFLVGHEAKLKELGAKYPKNAAFAIAEKYWFLYQGDAKAALDAARRAVAASPGYHLTHLETQGAAASVAGSIRGGRFWSEMTPDMQAKVVPLYQESIQESRTATELNPLNAMAWDDLAEATMFYGDRRDAIKAMERCMSLAGNRTLSAWVGLQLNDPKWGGRLTDKVAFANAVANDPGVTGDDALTVAKQLENEDMDAQAKVLRERELARSQRAVKESPSDPFAFKQLSASYAELGRREGADEAIERAIALDPGNGFLLAHASWVMADSKKWQRSVDIANACLKVDPKNSRCLGLRTVGLFRMARVDEALSAGREALATVPDQPMAVAIVAEILADRSQWSEAYKVFGQAGKEKDSSNWLDLIKRARHYSPEYYVTVAKTAAHFQPGNAKNWVSLTDAYHQFGKYRDQISTAQEALKLFPGDVALLDNLAEGYEYAGDKAAAIKGYRAVLERLKSATAQDADFWEKEALEGLKRLGVAP